jgi:peptidyl-prolyl cis-trans isomerase SurA
VSGLAGGLRSKLFALGAVVLLSGSLSTAHATIVERVVAVIGERPILWTELLRRATAARVQIRSQARDPNVVSLQEQEMYKELLDRMIDDRLEEQQADRAHITVSNEEIDRGIANIAAQAQGQAGRPLTATDIFEEVAKRGMSEQDFREEIRRQILEGKLVELRVRPRVRVTEQDATAFYQRWARDLKDQQPVDVRILALRMAPGATRSQSLARVTLGQELARRAREGEDFCKLVSEYSDDVSTRDSCGSRGAQPINVLLPAIQETVRSMRPGTVSDPVTVSTPQGDVVLVIMPLGEAHVPAYDEVKGDMMQRAMLDSIERARKQWLKDLRHNVYVDVRL